MEREELKGKKLLILAGNDVHMKVVEAAKELGVYTIVTDYLPFEESPAKKIADEYWNLSTGDLDLVVEKCKKEHVDGVLNFCIDTVQIAYQQICEKLGVPCYGTREIFKTFTNKIFFKQYCKEHGVSVIPEYTLNEVKNGQVVYPILIKPSDSRGSRGISICKDESSVNAAIELATSESKDGRVIIERYMIGDGCHDMGLAYMIIDGFPYLAKICDRVLGKEEDSLQCQQMASILPSVFADDYIKNTNERVCKMIQSLGIKFGVIFMQGVWENGDMYFYDPGVRFPGSDFDVITKNVTGFDSMKAFVEFAVTGNTKACYGDPLKAYNYNGGNCIILAISCKPGIIYDFEGFENVASMPEVMSARQIYKSGQSVPATHDVRQRVAEFVAYLPDRASVQPFIDSVYANLRILDENGNDMIVSKVNY